MKKSKVNWNSKESIEFVDAFVRAMQEQHYFGPRIAPTRGDPVDLEGLGFPTVSLCESFALPQVVVRRVCGKQTFNQSRLERVSLVRSVLDFSVWNDCEFDQINFDSASLKNCRFLGCQFKNCSFRKTHLEDVSFSVGRNGRESEVSCCNFEGTFFDGASSHNLVCKDIHFSKCKLGSFVFEGSALQRVKFTGTYDSLVFHGQPGEVERNRVHLDLSDALFEWFSANYGIEMSEVKLPSDGSCLILRDRIRAIEHLAAKLEGQPPFGTMSRMLKGIYGAKGPSPLSLDQDMILLSKLGLATLDEDLTEEQLVCLIQTVREIAGAGGYLLK